MSENNTNRAALPGRDRWGELYPFASHYLDLGESGYHYVDESPADTGEDGTPTLLFVHGNPTWSFHWRRLILANRGKYRCVAPDHLGCGLSDLQPRPLSLADHIDNLATLIESLDLRRITLVAQDWGGSIGLGGLLKLSDRFERVALFNTGAFPPWFIPWRIRVCRWPVVGRLALQGVNAFSRAALRMTVTRASRLDSRVEEAYLAPYFDWQHRGAVYQFVKDIPLSASHPTWKTLEQIEAGLPTLANMPTQLIWGMRDWCFTPECLDKFCSYWPQAEVHRLEDVGHWVVEDAPDQVETLLSDWLARTACQRCEETS
ncbi:MAG: alpha/beta fold hydrolase [Planctomycetes bacterium]|nr:alpha/beta fold hydrolase [Planctomycetota bacterium]